MRSHPAASDRKGAGPLAVVAHTGPLGELAVPWCALNDPAQPGAPFRAFAWLASWWSAFSHRGDPVVLCARSGDGELRGLLPLYAEPTALGTRLRLMGDGIVGSDYLGVIARSEDRDAVASACAAYLRQGLRHAPRSELPSGVRELDFDGLTKDDPLALALEGERTRTLLRYRCPLICTHGSFAAYIGKLPGGIGAQLRRRRRWLEQRPGYMIEELSAADEIAHGMEILLGLHRARWALEGGSDAIDGERVQAFHRTAARQLAALGWCRLYLLHVEGAPRAALYGFRHGRRFAFYQAGHEPAWRPRSVGTVLLGHVIERCFADALDEFDFLRGDEPYKSTWATDERATIRTTVRAAGLTSWLSDRSRRAFHGLRAAGKQLLPEDALAWMRATRRQLQRGSES